MYIEPNSYIRLMKNVPLDNSYTDTLFFTSKANQTAYFLNQTTGRNFTAQSYQRVQRGYIRLQVNAELIYDYNYLMFQNTAYGTRWFYAFINNVEYLNDNTTEVHFEIDVMQTWLFDVVLGASLVEREHFSEDTVGMNIQPEPIDIGPIQCNAVMSTGWFDDYYIVLGTTTTDENHGLVGGMYGAVNYSYAPLTGSGSGQMQSRINTLVESNKMDSIVAVFLMPASFIPSSGGGGGDVPWSSSPQVRTISIPIPNKCGNYTPRNKKLLTSPYTFLCVDTLNDAKNYRYEWSRDSGNITFTAIGSISPDPSITFYPTNYNGAWTNLVQTVGKNPTESITMRGFPQCAIAIDAYKAWLAQGAVSDGLNIMQSAITAGAGVVSGYMPMALHGATGMMQGINNAVVSATAGSKVRGVQGGDADVVSGQKEAYFKYMSVTEEYAEIIDDYFDRYGYACNQLKIPNRNARAHWTYCKTVECDISEGNAPADDLKKIKSIYNKGITWWNNPSEVGHYELLNTPNG